MTCAPRGISSTYSASVGRTAVRRAFARGADGDAVGLADDVGVREDTGVGVELAAVGECDEVPAALGVDEQRPRSPGRERRPSATSAHPRPRFARVGGSMLIAPT